MNKLSDFIEEKKYSIKFKKEVNMKEPEEYLKVIKFLADGKIVGYLIFGMDQENIIGIQNVKKSYQEVDRNIKKFISPEIETIIKIIHIENKNIILVKVIPQK